jgi:hypothetical protein
MRFAQSLGFAASFPKSPDAGASAGIDIDFLSNPRGGSMADREAHLPACGARLMIRYGMSPPELARRASSKVT